MNPLRKLQIDRRKALSAFGAMMLGCGEGVYANPVPQAPSANDTGRADAGRANAGEIAKRLGVSLERIRGLLIGSLLGDALGGPIEFLDSDRLPENMPHERRRPATSTIDVRRQTELANSLELRGYESLRPDTAAYGPWRRSAPAGTITDDSRHKIIVLRAIKRSLSSNAGDQITFDRPRLANEYLRPMRHVVPAGELADQAVQILDREGFRQYRHAASWWASPTDQSRDGKIKTDSPFTGERPLPPERLWAGVPNCSGQMALLPLAAIFAGQPEACYKATYNIDFLDSDHAVDFCAAINAGIAEVLSSRHEAADSGQRIQSVVGAMRSIDPFDYQQIPYAGRPFAKWLQRGVDWATAADQIPQRLFSRLESEGKPNYWWDAHFTFVVPFAILHLCPDNPMAAMNLCLDFGHDTDSYAQLLGAWIGAIYGPDVFPRSMVRAVEHRLSVDYGETIDDWCDTLLHAAELVHSKNMVFARGTQRG